MAAHAVHVQGVPGPKFLLQFSDERDEGLVRQHAEVRDLRTPEANAPRGQRIEECKCCQGVE